MLRLLCSLLLVYAVVSPRRSYAQTPTLEDRIAALERRLDSLNVKIPEGQRSIEERVAFLEAKLGGALATQAKANVPALDLAVERREEKPQADAKEPMEMVAMEGGSEEPVSEFRDVVTGYGEFRYGKRSNQDGNAGLGRFVLYFGHRFSPRIRFASALEVEAPQIGETGGGTREVVLGQAFMEFLATPRLSVRSGILLAPIGIINEKHEPMTFNGVNRPLVETYIVPSGWRDVGTGIAGQFGNGWRYRAYVMGGLNAAGFTAEGGIRGGRQGGQAFSNLRNPAQVGRLEYLGIRGLSIGASGYTSRGGFDLKTLNPRVALAEFDGQYVRGRFNLRGLFASVWIRRAGELNELLEHETSTNPNIASRLGGWYIEPAWNLLRSEGHRAWFVFVRQEKFDTQRSMPSGFLPRSEFRSQATVFGTTFHPIQDVVLKLDYVFGRNPNAPGRIGEGLNIGLGWYF